MSIVERLRVTHQIDTGNGYYETVRDPLRTEAADLIESLQAKIAELEAECDGWREDANISKVSLDMLKGRCDHFEEQFATLRKRIDDAPVVVVNVGASYVLDRPGVYRLISKEDLK